ncbi:hypothetical protein JI735_02935 [Paenibacillus sonchi]|uniref:Uncharacterized protein n=1 Tax=Paenibacillus sonchi TaxID=373687 RepID=A0A974SDC4_9BACL|nr:hypothetical protein [Paenibacillus sonchi]QQZ61722.1 hypothetical protein JI735_02935 [Paenibacillus sonchi]
MCGIPHAASIEPPYPMAPGISAQLQLMPVLEALGETRVETHVVCFGVALLKGVSRRRFRRDAQIRGSCTTCATGGTSTAATTSIGG